jgi:SAM-dependent methyltransferase
MSAFVATDPEGYEPYVGRWSRRLAPLFVAFAGVTGRERILDVGCGTGNLTRALGAAKAVVTGIDLSASYIAYARQHTSDSGVTFEVGDAEHLPYSDGTFDRSLSMLALDTMPQAARALAEMRRVTRPGGTVAALVNDFRCGWAPFSMLIDTAAVLDPRASTLRDQVSSEPLRWPGGLAALFCTAGFAEVTEGQISTLFEYASFADYWSSFLTGQGIAGSYVASLAEAPRKELERHLRPAYLCGKPDGPRGFTTWCYAVRSDVPAVT